MMRWASTLRREWREIHQIVKQQGYEELKKLFAAAYPFYVNQIPIPTCSSNAHNCVEYLSTIRQPVRSRALRESRQFRMHVFPNWNLPKDHNPMLYSLTMGKESNTQNFLPILE